MTRFRVSTLTGYPITGRSECVSYLIHDSAYCFHTVWESQPISTSNSFQANYHRRKMQEEAERRAKRLERQHA